jgi:hypothetical protein
MLQSAQRNIPSLMLPFCRVADLGIFRTNSKRKKLAGDLIGVGGPNKTPQKAHPDFCASDMFVWLPEGLFKTFGT